MKKITQEAQVIDALRNQGGYATLRRLYEVIDFSTWKTQTPEATVRQIVQLSKHIFKIQPGLWALEEARDKVLKKFKIVDGDKSSEEKFSHSYYQGLLIEIGRLSNFKTYIPPQDKHHQFLEKELGEMSDLKILPQFTYEKLLRKARSVDVIWFNEREMPTQFYEVEHTTDIKNSLSKFYELQDFYASFHIVAGPHRENEFKDKINASIFSSIKNRVKFVTYDKVAKLHSNLTQQQTIIW
ncbi:MAG: hypothetical protein K2O43_00560 [Muribaculaceae bacterium]|nr:hypothetical protein [Muribaculaceae bacterium]